MVDVLDLDPATEALPASLQLSPVVDILPDSVVDPIPLYSTRSWGIDAFGLCSKAQDNLDAVRTVRFPAVVKTRITNTNRLETPVLSETGGGVSSPFCIVLAEPDGRPIGINNVTYINHDPMKVTPQHGTARVAIGMIIGILKREGAVRTILIYEIVDLKELVRPKPVEEIDERNKNKNNRNNEAKVASLTCELIGHEIADWRGKTGRVPDKLIALYAALECRIKSDVDVPMYMDMLRGFHKPDKDTMAWVKKMNKPGLYNTEESHPSELMTSLLSEVLEIRREQYAKCNKERRVERLLGVAELRIVEGETQAVLIRVMMIRNDSAMPIIFKTTLTGETFYNVNGRYNLDRALLLDNSSFDALYADLVSHDRQKAAIGLLCLR